MTPLWYNNQAVLEIIIMKGSLKCLRIKKNLKKSSVEDL